MKRTAEAVTDLTRHGDFRQVNSRGARHRYARPYQDCWRVKEGCGNGYRRGSLQRRSTVRCSIETNGTVELARTPGAG